jgi:plastocyanin
MHKRHWAVATAFAAVAIAAAGCGGGNDEGAGDTEGEATGASVEPGMTLVAKVGPGFDISLTTENGEEVTSAAAGEYTIEVDDEADIHNFHLTGPGVDEDSGVSETGQSTWTVTLEPGTYDFVCDPHSGSMNGSFEVTG